MKYTVLLSAVALAILTSHTQAAIDAAPTPAPRDSYEVLQARQTTNIGIGPDVSIGSGATVVIDGSTFSNPAKSSSSGTSSSSTTAGAAASSIRSGILSSLSANTASNSANAASIRSGIESSLSAATATPSIQIDGAEPMALTFNALMAFMAAVITGAFLV